MKTRFLLGGVAIALSGVSAAWAATAPAPATPAGHHGRMMKTELRTEVPAAVARHFERVDTNHDGFITKAEADAIQVQRAENLKQRADKRFDSGTMFARLDGNHDGKVTQAEAEAARAAFHAKSGKAAAPTHPAFGGLFARADANKDGAITRAEFDALANQMHARVEKAGLSHGFADRMFTSADANKDGKVSLAEAQQATLQHFDKTDLNHDGKITPEERMQTHQHRRAAKQAAKA